MTEVAAPYDTGTAVGSATSADLNQATLLSPDTAPAPEPTPTPAPVEPPKAPEPEPKPVEGAPEKYEFKPPEGAEYDPDILGQFSEAAKELNLPQDKAQAFLDKMAPALAARQEAQLEAVKTEWAEASRADTEFGGDKLAENLAIAKTAAKEFASPELMTLLETSGLGNNPEVLRLFYRVGKAISQDGFVTGGKGKTTHESVAQRLYPSMNP